MRVGRRFSHAILSATTQFHPRGSGDVGDEANNFSRNRIPPAPFSIDLEGDIIGISPLLP